MSPVASNRHDIDEPVDTDAELHRLTNAALGLLARREYSRGELEEKLGRRSQDAALIDQVLDALEEQGLQSDERFTEHFVRYRVSQGKGPIKIRQDLRMKHISSRQIDDCLDQDDEFWREQAFQVYQRKFSGAPVNDDKDFAKRLRFMVSRGYSAHLIYPLIEASKRSEF